MPQTTNYAEIQQDELEALRSIYMQDFEENEIKTGAWNVGYNVLENQRPSDDLRFKPLTSPNHYLDLFHRFCFRGVELVNAFSGDG